MKARLETVSVAQQALVNGDVEPTMEYLLSLLGEFEHYQALSPYNYIAFGGPVQQEALSGEIRALIREYAQRQGKPDPFTETKENEIPWFQRARNEIKARLRSIRK